MIKEKGIYRHNETSWEARFKIGVDSDGKPIYKSVYAKTRDEVIAKKLAIVGEEPDPTSTPKEMNLLILGSGSHGKDVYEVARSLRIFKKISFLDDEESGEDIIDKCKNVLRYRGLYPCAFVAIGDNQIRKKYAEMLKKYHFLLPNLISPMAHISPKVVFGEGVVVLPMARIGDAKIGDFCIVASKGLVNTDATVGDYSHVDSGAIVKIGAKVTEGMWVRSGEIF